MELPVDIGHNVVIVDVFSVDVERLVVAVVIASDGHLEG